MVARRVVGPVMDRPLLLALAIAALFGVILNEWLQHVLQESPIIAPKHLQLTPDYTLKDFTVNAMDRSGALRHRLAGKSLAHFGADDTTTIEAPRLEVRRPSGEGWQIQAPHAWLSAGGKTVLLQGEVTMTRQQFDRPPLTITTHDLRVLPDTQYADTAHPVLAVEPRGTLRAIGMTLDMKQGQLRLLSQVRAVYAPG